MVKLIQNIPSANDGEQDKDNITKYLESNKDSLLDLAEKNYENLVEELTDNAIATVSATSPTPTLSLPSTSTFQSPSDPSDTYIIEDPESFLNSKGDIAD
jgi:hypothetical protein